MDELRTKLEAAEVTISKLRKEIKVMDNVRFFYSLFTLYYLVMARCYCKDLAVSIHDNISFCLM